jgi:hypothetical protein
LKAQYDKLLSTFAFNFNLRRYNEDGINAVLVHKKDDDDPERSQMREQIQGALQKTYADSLSNVTYAASEARP